MGRKLIDLTGQRFGKLVAIKPVGKNKSLNYLWLCKCDCDKEVVTGSNSLIKGNTKSCGCLLIKHGHSHSERYDGESPTYKSWVSMKQRCNNPKNPGYKNYGGRGITVCERWLKFENFLEDMGERPHRLSLDRIDNNKGYYKENCRWATRNEQNRNQRSNINISLDGKLLCLKDYCKQKNINYSMVIVRLSRGWSLKNAVNIQNCNLNLQRNLIMSDDLNSISKELDKFKTEAFVKKVGPSDRPWCVITEQTGKNMGCYPTKKEAEDRLAQIHQFSK
jgi:hypothetical protein